MSAYDKQIGGTHYKKMKIQPSKFVIENKLLFPEGNVIKYICRHPYKGGKEDLEKAKHFIDMIIERDYMKSTTAEETDEADSDYLKLLQDASHASQKDERQDTSQKKWIEGYTKWKASK
jgi:hypothetical protein